MIRPKCHPYWIIDGKKVINPNQTSLALTAKGFVLPCCWADPILKDAFIHFLSNDIKFDFIYIDSEKSGKSVIQDFALSFISLNKGGILMFDDYYLDREQDPLEDSKMALNMVMYQYQKEIRLIHKGKRCIIQKVKS